MLPDDLARLPVDPPDGPAIRERDDVPRPGEEGGVGGVEGSVGDEAMDGSVLEEVPFDATGSGGEEAEVATPMSRSDEHRYGKDECTFSDRKGDDGQLESWSRMKLRTGSSSLNASLHASFASQRRFACAARARLADFTAPELYGREQVRVCGLYGDRWRIL